jgi:hypothetical protein
LASDLLVLPEQSMPVYNRVYNHAALTAIFGPFLCFYGKLTAF